MEVSTVIITLTVAAFAALGYFLYQRRKDSKKKSPGSRGGLGSSSRKRKQ